MSFHRTRYVKIKDRKRWIVPAAVLAAALLTGCTDTKQLMDEGVRQLEQSEYETAADTFMEVLENLQWYDGLERTDVLLYRAEALLGEGEYESARKVYEGLLEKDAQNAEYPLYSGIASMGAGDYDTAEASFLDAADKGNEQAYAYAGKAAEAREDYEKAAAYYEQALEEQPDNAELYTAIGRCLIEEGCCEEALQVLEKGIAAAANIGAEAADTLQELLYEQAVAYEYLGDFETARDRLEAYVMRYPDDAKARKEYAFVQTR